ncbi:N-acetyl-alpha-D-glucosaminyl L-malate synthase BshA [Macrococcoides canis]|uniref:N-acetyl-alpha-D-glucosaminyl L-malate synthase BshA n=1 Tax=Macrococcoides canis TaxID=1855823 RepID=UPI00105C3256|nr:N-acetyl-alpha-D-glucosaminyl L-malate synthase BshA [Macrococcus canis]MEE1108272.1 N-acetyl-alpha-D-glucosaminyl L-malate synthase BshA [Macrococcus canis]TDM23456.1 N-acetyl-alpha-D-glucosaminyl L-malate synthase BshA [Macrococcus canis]TDM34771.1 N-acetyl-alpha-D-glucosaminyl L-malate synthase BshA [Macrococcus canis]TDM43281.1 N-acetyl-alpha-D-glucosaminyl L-malate synthase BshA [Macrococcus canis]
MKIGITCYPTMGGSGIIATELGIKMAKRGHDVHFITSNTPFRIHFQMPNITVHQVDVNQYSVFQYPPYDITLATKIAEVINLYDLDVLHMHYAVPHAICGILARQIARKDVKIVTTLHGTDITVLGYDSTLKEAIKFGIEDSDVVTSVSNSLTEETYEIVGPKKEIQTVYNFINETDFNNKSNPELRACYGISEEEKVIVHVSNFRKVKRIQDILKTFKAISEKIDSKLLLIGDGPELSNMRVCAEQLCISDKVLFLGKQEQVAPLYQMADLFLLMSEKESFGLVLLEAMHSGVVCIGTTAGGIKEVIKHEETGYIVDVGDTQAAAEYALALLTDDILYERFQKNMIDDINSRFSSEHITNQYEAIYRNLIEGARL